MTVGGERTQPATVEAGTGFFEERFTRREIEQLRAQLAALESRIGTEARG